MEITTPLYLFLGLYYVIQTSTIEDKGDIQNCLAYTLQNQPNQTKPNKNKNRKSNYLLFHCNALKFHGKPTLIDIL